MIPMPWRSVGCSNCTGVGGVGGTIRTSVYITSKAQVDVEIDTVMQASQRLVS